MSDNSKNGAKGGLVRAANLSSERRTEIASNAAKQRWMNQPEITPEMPRVIEGYSSVLNILGRKLPCAVIQSPNGVQRVLSEHGITNIILGTRSGASKKRENSWGIERAPLPLFVASKGLNEFITKDLMDGPLKAIYYVEGSRVVRGYDASIIVSVCKIWLKARAKGKLQRHQLPKAQQAETLLAALAETGITALIDEVTGYQEDRAKNALATIFSTFLAKHRQDWTLTFPLDFYREIYRLKQWKFEPWNMKRPMIIAKWTDDFVYDRLAPGLTEELRNKNPVAETGRRSHHHHQLFNTDRGHPKLKEHISGVIALLRVADNWLDFIKMIDRAYPKFTRDGSDDVVETSLSDTLSARASSLD